METEPRPANTADEMEAIKRQRDGLAAALLSRERPLYADESISAVMDAGKLGSEIAQKWLAAHDRAVAARVLRDILGKMQAGLDYDELLNVASQYERGEREVPGA